METLSMSSRFCVFLLLAGTMCICQFTSALQISLINLKQDSAVT